MRTDFLATEGLLTCRDAAVVAKDMAATGAAAPAIGAHLLPGLKCAARLGELAVTQQVTFEVRGAGRGPRPMVDRP
jgi:hypothetical protein